MDSLLSLVRRNWVMDPTMENAERYIRLLERSSLFPALPAKNRRRASAEISSDLHTALNARLEMLRYGHTLHDDEDPFLEVGFTRRPRQYGRRSKSAPKHPLHGARFNLVSLVYEPHDGERLKLSEILQLIDIIQDHLGGEIVDIGVNYDQWTQMGGQTHGNVVVEIWITYPDLA